ncbi:hypothetical protein OBV_p-00450 (plasmid) [Oscillibacter valericigenes Sjm18-20]|nr:hypothetical protein OBV_p-00450 [Oscillibacter valericigenes Sjm18-20]
MLQAQFCFIKDDFFDKYDKGHKLLQNKEQNAWGEHNRPCFFVFDDSRENAIKWCVPISSRVEKYSEIAEHKKEKQRMHGATRPVCKQICFAKVMNRPRAFLVQNMFPITEKYIDGYYMNKDGKPVCIESRSATFIERCAKDLLQKYMMGVDTYSLFADVKTIRQGLIQELTTERVTPAPQEENAQHEAIRECFTAAAEQTPPVGDKYTASPPTHLSMKEYGERISQERDRAIQECVNLQAKCRTRKATEKER